MYLIFLLVLAAGVGLFAYLKNRSDRQIDEAWEAFKDRSPLVRRMDPDLGKALVGLGARPVPKAGRMIPYSPETYRSFDSGPSAYVTTPSTGYTQPVTESILATQAAYETVTTESSCSPSTYDSSSSYSSCDSSSSYSDSGSSSCSCD